MLLAYLVSPSSSAAIKGAPLKSAPIRQQPFYATKSAPQVVQQQQEPQQQEEEAALPGFVEPPEAPAPEPDAGEPMMPYSFEYTANGPDGGSSRRESNDGQRVTGTYTMNGPDGIQRIVHYVADKDGYRATIVTNEPGTESQNPAATELRSSQEPAEQIALRYGPRGPAEGEPRAAPVRFPAPIPALPQFDSRRSAPLRASTTTNGASSFATTLRASSAASTTASFGSSSQSTFASTQTTALPARLVLADSGVKGAPIVQQRLVAPPAPVKSAPVKARPPPPPPAPTQLWQAVTAPRTPSKTRTTLRPPPPPPAPLRSKTNAQVVSKTAPIKSASKAPFYQTTTTSTTTTTTTTPAPLAPLVQQREEQQFEEIQQQEQEPVQQQEQQQERLQEQEIETNQPLIQQQQSQQESESDGAFFAV